MSPKSRVDEKVLYTLAKAKKIGKAEARWQYGVWLGSVEPSDEHLIGATFGVKSRGRSPPSRRTRGSTTRPWRPCAEPLWKPSSRHPGTKTRTHIEENNGDPYREGDGGEPGGSPEVHLEEDPGYAGQKKRNNAKGPQESQELVTSRPDESRPFYNMARGVFKHGPTKSCPGCRFALGEASAQSAARSLAKRGS